MVRALGAAGLGHACMPGRAHRGEHHPCSEEVGAADPLGEHAPSQAKDQHRDEDGMKRHVDRRTLSDRHVGRAELEQRGVPGVEHQPGVAAGRKKCRPAKTHGDPRSAVLAEQRRALADQRWRWRRSWDRVGVPHAIAQTRCVAERRLSSFPSNSGFDAELRPLQEPAGRPARA